MADQLIVDFENDKKLVFKDSNNPRYGFEVTFGDFDEQFTKTLDREDRIQIIQFLVNSL